MPSKKYRERGRRLAGTRWVKKQLKATIIQESVEADNGPERCITEVSREKTPPVPVEVEPLTRLRPKKTKMSYVDMQSIKIIDCPDLRFTKQATTSKYKRQFVDTSRCFVCGILRSTKKKPKVYITKLSQPPSVASAFVRLISSNAKNEIMRVQMKTILNRIAASYFCQRCGDELSDICKMYRQLDRINLIHRNLESAKLKIMGQIKSNYDSITTDELYFAEATETREQKLRRDILNISEWEDAEVFPNFPFSRVEMETTSEDRNIETVELNPMEEILDLEHVSDYIKAEQYETENQENSQDYDYANHASDLESSEMKDPLEFEKTVKTVKAHILPTVPVLKEVFICKLCDRVYTSEEQFQTHDKECPMKMPNRRCKICGLEGLTVSKLKYHIKSVHRNPNRGHCEVCGKLAKNLKLHFAKSHQADFTCSICGLEGLTVTRLKHHITSVHSNRNRGHCEVCGKLAKDLKVHFARFHHTEFTCSICDAHFNNYLEYNYHRTTHPELKLRPVKCEQCGKILVSNEALLTHQRITHEKRYPIICEICGWGTQFKPQLLEHKRYYHEGIRDFICEICDATLSTKLCLSRHLKKHRGEIIKKYKCSYCSKSFAGLSKKQGHEAALHGGELKYSCEHCGKRFPIKNYLYIHLRSHETPEQKEARRLKAKQNAEARRVANKPVLIPKGRPRVKDVVGP